MILKWIPVYNPWHIQIFSLAWFPELCIFFKSTCLTHGSPFLKIFTCPTSKISFFQYQIIYDLEEKFVQIYLPHGQFYLPRAIGQWDMSSLVLIWIWHLLLLFYVFAERSEGQIELCLKSGGGLQREKWIISRHDSEKSCTDSKSLHHRWRDQLFMWRSRYSEIFISTYIPTYKGNSLWKSLYNHRCYFGFTFEVRFCHVISLICIAISEIGNANSQVSKPNVLMRWFSQLISVSLGGFDANCTDNISTLQN